MDLSAEFAQPRAKRRPFRANSFREQDRIVKELKVQIAVCRRVIVWMRVAGIEVFEKLRRRQWASRLGGLCDGLRRAEADLRLRLSEYAHPAFPVDRSGRPPGPDRRPPDCGMIGRKP
jgi:hypothetical protein